MGASGMDTTFICHLAIYNLRLKILNAVRSRKRIGSSGWQRYGGTRSETREGSTDKGFLHLKFLLILASFCKISKNWLISEVVSDKTLYLVLTWLNPKDSRKSRTPCLPIMLTFVWIRVSRVLLPCGHLLHIWNEWKALKADAGLTGYRLPRQWPMAV